MLNACLTVRAHEAASHKNKGWERFTQKVIDTAAKTRTRGLVFLAWGSQAQQRCKGLGTSGKHLVLQSVHPSPLSAHNGFLTCGHFKKTNEWLKNRYGEEGIIDWNLDKPKPIAAPQTDGPVKVTADQSRSSNADDSTTALNEEKHSVAPANTTTAEGLEGGRGGQPPDDEDADAIEALTEIVQAEAMAEEQQVGKEDVI